MAVDRLRFLLRDDAMRHDASWLRLLRTEEHDEEGDDDSEDDDELQEVGGETSDWVRMAPENPAFDLGYRRIPPVGEWDLREDG